jgi:hypothetical protein
MRDESRALLRKFDLPLAARSLPGVHPASALKNKSEIGPAIGKTGT